MILLIVLTVVMLVMLLFPFFMARSSMESTKGISLLVKNDNRRDPRYFGNSFTAMMDRALETYDGSGRITLSKPEQLTEAETLSGSDPCSTLVLARGIFRPVTPRVYEKEIYCLRDGTFPPGTALRAAAARGQITLKKGCMVARWVDADQMLFVEEGCDLGVSAGSGERLEIAPGCRFIRLFSPEIRVTGGRATRCVPCEERVSQEVERYVDRVDEYEERATSIVAKGDLVIGEGAVILGSVKGHRRIRVCSGASVAGNLIANGTIVLEDDVSIGGVVFSQRDVFVGSGTRIGRQGKIKSVIARENLTLCEGCGIYGYAACEKKGVTLHAEDFADAISEQY